MQSQGLPFQSWRIRKAGDTIESKSEGLRNRSSDVQRQEKMDVLPQEERVDSPFLHFEFYLALQEIGKHLPTLVKGDSLLSLPESNANLFQKHLPPVPTPAQKQCLATYLGCPYPSHGDKED